MRTARDADSHGCPNVVDLAFERSLVIEDLNPFVSRIGDVHVPLSIHGKRVGCIELALFCSALSPGLDEFAVLVELCDASIAMSVGYEDVTRGIPCHIGRPVERVSRAACARCASSTAACTAFAASAGR